MRKIIVIQHCQSEHHINNMSGGWTDTPLTNLGKLQSIAIADKLSEMVINSEYKMFSSDLVRARQTAEIIAKSLDKNVILVEDLREINTGLAAGRTKEWANSHRNEEIKFSLDYREFEKGETRREFLVRVSKCMDNLWNNSSNDLIIVTHGGTLAMILKWWLGFNDDMSVKDHFQGEAGSISILSVNKYNQHVVEKFNDTEHLSELRRSV